MKQKKNAVEPDLSAFDLEVIRDCQTRGMIALFAKAVRMVTTRPPTDIEGYFAKFLSEKSLFYVRATTRRALRQEFGLHIDLWRAFGIVMVLSNGRVCHFAPLKDLVMKKITNDGVGYAPNANKLFRAALIGQTACPEQRAERGFNPDLRRKLPSR